MIKQALKIDMLEKLYDLYDQYIESIEVACCKGCSSCCTCNVTMTTLERAYLLNSLDPSCKEKLRDQIRANISDKRYHPKVTLNRFAQICMDGKEPPEEENDPLWGQCPLLKDDICAVYNARPFGCRSLVSEKRCTHSGFAEMSSLALTINSIFLQYIEHLDADGFSGNFTDMILLHDLKTDSFEKRKKITKGNIIRNHKATVLMVPPEHKDKVQPLLKEICQIFG
ncbi:MAG: hypothetical protein U9N77_01265 [Thermodesulfobacteriota bacterium]|nr:hypothetical protein [Thermodesulfobacteriota bacterium]